MRTCRTRTSPAYGKNWQPMPNSFPPLEFLDTRREKDVKFDIVIRLDDVYVDIQNGPTSRILGVEQVLQIPEIDTQ